MGSTSVGLCIKGEFAVESFAVPRELALGGTVSPGARPHMASHQGYREQESRVHRAWLCRQSGLGIASFRYFLAGALGMNIPGTRCHTRSICPHVYQKAPASRLSPTGGFSTRTGRRTFVQASFAGHTTGTLTSGVIETMSLDSCGSRPQGGDRLVHEGLNLRITDT